MSLPSIIYPVTSVVERLDLAALFPCPRPLEVELGSGDGSFLSQYAAAHPERNFVGLERLLGRLRKTEKKCLRASLDNVRGIRLEASYFLEWLLPAGAVEAIHVYFPDPWPKRKHRPRRLINHRFTSLALTALRPGGHVYLRTDDADYFAQMQSVFAANPSFAPVDTPVELAAVTTDFERGFQRRGIGALRAAYASLKR